MTAPDLERRLTRLLHERAEGAMNTTNTQEKLASLLANSSRRLQRRRGRWATGGLVVAAATAAVLFWVANGDTEPVEPAPAGIDTVGLATTFLEAIYAHDTDRAEGMMSPEVRIGGDSAFDEPASVAEWREEIAWNAAIGVSLADRSCSVGATTASTTEVSCVYAIHALGSERLGRGPFEGNTLDVTIRDGEIVEFQDAWDFMRNGFSAEMWEPFAAWVAQEHPADARTMYTDSSHSEPRFGPASLRLWEQRIADYVATQR